MGTARRYVAMQGVCFALFFAGSGCYNVDAVKAFLREPRAPVSGIEYRVLPPDVITITSLHVPEIDRVTQQIRPDGKINLPLVGELSVAGRTPAEIEGLLTLAAKEYYDEVDATVVVSAYRSQNFYVFGQAARQGPMPWTGHDTLLDALAKAQPTSLAWLERIIVLRGDEPQEGGYATSRPVLASLRYRMTGKHSSTKDRPRRKIVVNLMAMVKSGDMSNNILLMPNDVIYVQPNPLARIGLAVQNLLFPIRPVTEMISTPATAARSATMGP